MQDFEPYFCTVEDCDAPFDLVNTFEGLLQHLQERHVEECFHVDLPNGEHKEFDDAGIDDYFTQKGVISEEDLALIKGAALRKGAYLFDSCPFCGGYPDVLEKSFSDQNTPEAQVQLRRHIKMHMQTIALFFPPYREDAFENQPDGRSVILSSLSERAHHSAASQVVAANGPQDPEDFRSICSREDCDCKDKGRLSDNELSGLLRPPESDDADYTSEDTDFWADISPGLSRSGYAALAKEDFQKDPILSHLLTDDENLEQVQTDPILSPATTDDESSEETQTVSNHFRHPPYILLPLLHSICNAHQFPVYWLSLRTNYRHLTILATRLRPTSGNFQLVKFRTRS